MPGSATAFRQERLKKTHARPIPLGLFTINEEDEQQKNGNSRRPKVTCLKLHSLHINPMQAFGSPGLCLDSFPSTYHILKPAVPPMPTGLSKR
ncbi:hypothetical protein ACRRTK_001378 [Alexandromys fortis]